MKTLCLLKQKLKLGLLKVLSLVLTKHSKRSIFLTFIFMRLQNVFEYDKQLFSSMNEVCNLVSSVDALKLPAVLIQHFFNDEIGRCNNMNCDFKTYAREVLSKVPFWICYNEIEMRKDLLDIIRYCNVNNVVTTR